MGTPFVFRHRDRVAALPAAALGAALVLMSGQAVVQLARQQDTVTISLLEPAAESPPTPPPPPSQPPRPEPVPRPAPVAQAPRAPEPQPVDTRAAVEAPQPQPMRPPPPAAPPPVSAAPPPPEAPAAPAARVAVENSYAAQVRAYLDSVKRYPTSREARSLRPQGKVRLWLTVARDGTLLEAGLYEGSGSMILDNAALVTVRQGRYPPFPAEAWPGDDRHRFTVTLEYQLEGG